MKQFAVGDHIFCWCSYLGVPFAFQHHAIVVATQTTTNDDDDDDDGESSSSSIVIMNFDHHEDEDEDGKDVNEWGDHDGSSDISGKSQNDLATKNDNDQDEPHSPQQAQQQQQSPSTPEKFCSMTLQTISVEEAQSKWEHVAYNQDWHQRLWSRAGTCSSAQPDPVPIVLCRLSFLKQNQPELLGTLSYHHHKRNGECLAVWCKMGEYTSFQGAAKMGEAGCHVGSFSLVGGIAAQVAASVVVPPLLPFMAAYDVGHTVVSFRELHATKIEWKERSVLWNELFHKYMLENYHNNNNSQQPTTTPRP